MKIKDFFSNEFKEFSLDDTKRSLPSIIDGLKESQRKIVYGLTTRGETADKMKVAQLAALVAERTDYHHGEKSLETAIVGLAQDFPGSNNINLLEPLGQFGSRLSSEPSASRYIFTKFSSYFRQLFKKDDEIILKHIDSDGVKIEPEYYLPLLPTILINGSIGIGTGYACKILSHNPKDIKACIIQRLSGKRQKKILPWYKTFKGGIREEEGSVLLKGGLMIKNTSTIVVNELPIGVYLDNYKTHLNKLEMDGIIKEYQDSSTEHNFEFTVKVSRTMTQLPEAELIKIFKLETKHKQNLTMWNTNNKIQVYKDANEIISEFTEFRLTKYEERRLKQISMITEELAWHMEKLNFIKFYLTNSVTFTKKNKEMLFKMIKAEGFTHVDRLLSLKIYTLTKDEIFKLKDKIKDGRAKKKSLELITAKEIYLRELSELKL